METKILIFIQFVILYIGSYNTINIDKDYECFNPNNVTAVCISLYSCPTLLDVFMNSPENVDDQKFLEESYCDDGFGNPPYVCCTNEISFSEIKLQLSTPESNELPGPDECIWKEEDMGMRKSYMFGSLEGNTKTWIYNCIGSLINSRYVLTTAWCGKVYKLTKFVFGENPQIDCEDDSACLKHDLIYDIEKIIVHENYTITEKDDWDIETNDAYWENDIALVRLSQVVAYTDKIRPLCLPSVVAFEGSQVDDEITLLSRKFISNDQQYFISTAKVINMEKCKKELEYSIQHICIDSGFGHYAWYNIGSPLVRNYKNTKIIDAIFSNGFISDPKVRTYTRVSEYEEWIKSKLEP